MAYGTVKEWMRKGRAGQDPFVTFTTTIRVALKTRELKFVEFVTAAAEKDAKAAQWMLTHRYSKRWADREKVEADINATGEVRHIYVPTKKKP